MDEQNQDVMNKDYNTEEEQPHWIHDQEENDMYFGGIKILPSCTCSVCGYHTNREKTVCPKCGTHMK